MYKEEYYVIGYPFDTDKDFLDCAMSYSTIEQAKTAIAKREFYGRCHKEDFEIAKITITIERGIK